MDLLKYLILPALLLTGSGLLAQDNGNPIFTFGVIADVQYANQDHAGTRHYRSSPEKLREAVKTFNQQEVDFVLSLGDFIDKGFQHFDTLTAITGKLHMPLHHVLGNHDFAINPDEKTKLLSTLDLKKAYYSFTMHSWRLIILDGNDISLLANEQGSEKYRRADSLLKKLKAAGAPNARDWNGAVGKEQTEWLEKELSLARQNAEKVIIACHYPLYPDEAPELLWNAKSLRNLVEAGSNVFAYFNGHTHASEYFQKNGVNYVGFRGMVEKEENAFAIVSVFTDRLEITGYGKEVSRRLISPF